MNNYFTYRVDFSVPNNNVLVCYVAGLGFEHNKFSEIIKQTFDRSPFSRDLVIVSASYNKKHIDIFLKDDGFIKKLKQKINNYQILNIHTFFMNDSGKEDGESFFDPIEKNRIDIKSKSEFLLKSGLREVIKRRNLVMESTGTYHFVKPSGKHSSRFIKAANTMESGAEISFFSLNLLKFCPSKIDKIYTDTPGIFPVAYELLLMKNRFDGVENDAFIDSFNSYEGLKKYNFSGGENSLVIISASTSDDLALELKRKVGLSRAKIISIFSSCPHAEKSNTLVKFEDYRNFFNDDYFRGFESQDGHNCKLCIYESSIPLSLSNSQFIYEAPTTKYYLPFVLDSDKKLRGIISNYKNSGAFKCLFDGLEGTKSPAPEYFIDINALIKNNEEYKNKVRNVIQRSFPLSANLIVHADDHGAEALAKYIAEIVLALDRYVDVFSVQNLDLDKKCSGIIVVAGSIQSGKSLLDISRKLREYKDVPITYIVGFAKYNSPESYQKLKADLEFNNNCPALGRHQLIAIDEIILPINERRKNSWVREEELIKIVRGININDTQSLMLLDERLSVLKSATSKSIKGLGADIFIKKSDGSKMVLSPTFAFWDEEDAKEEFSHQGTVYFTISSIIQSLRHIRKNGKEPVLSVGYVVNQLDPLLFDRFNEGIIQACFLRAAKPRELDYRSDDRASGIISSLIIKMIKNPNDNFSEALPEFLLALCTEVLQIKIDHLEPLGNIALDKNTHPYSWILLEYFKMTFLNKVKPDIPL